MSIIAAHQPNFLPNLAFFSKMKQADKFVVITNLQFEKQEGWQQRQKIKTPVVLDEDVTGNKHELLINICKKHGADTYLSGVGAKDYLNKERLKEIEKNNIKHIYVKKNLTAMYPYSTVHYLLHEGKDWVLNVI